MGAQPLHPRRSLLDIYHHRPLPLVREMSSYIKLPTR